MALVDAAAGSRNAAIGLAGLLLLALAVGLAGHGGGMALALLASALAVAALAALAHHASGRLAPLAPGHLLCGLGVALIAASANDGIRLWQAAGSWSDAFTFSPFGAGAAAALIVGGTAWATLRHGGRAPSPVLVAGLIVAPYLLSVLFLLRMPWLLRDMAAGLTGTGLDPLPLILGRTAILFLVAEAALLGLGWLMDRRGTRDRRVHGVAFLSALLASLTPHLADIGSSRVMAGLPAGLHLVAVPAVAAVALAGLWAQVFLLTGVLLDALRGRRPTGPAVLRHWREGLGKGAVYSVVFMLIVHVAATAMADPTAAALAGGFPLTLSAVLGAALFPLLRTIIESFDGSRPFVHRLRMNTCHGADYLRGAVVGTGVGLAFLIGLPASDGLVRFLFGCAVGLTAYAGVDLARDLWTIAQNRRLLLPSWRVYALGAALGGIVGGAVAWYLDPVQLATIGAKLQSYAAVHFPAAGRVVEDYVIYPLFSKYGETNLGPAYGGVRLLYNEALSGVINWSLAAPLFSINLVLLTALLRRSLDPLRGLMTAGGMVGLVEQAIRVLRWGLWMAPVIYSLLRMVPDPTWYNQDGAVRTAVAATAAWFLPAGEFRAWSLQVFLGLLAYDWFRILVWFDHMGLRVATLVNLSFVGGDMADEKSARFLGHSMPSRSIPEAIRRFATWAPLLIPFYIPRGAEWSYVWGEAERMQAAAPGLLPPVAAVLAGYALLAVAALAVVGVTMQRSRGTSNKADPSPASPAAGSPPAFAPERRRTIGNGLYTVELGEDGCGFSRVLRGDREIDITRRPDDRLQPAGKFFYLRDLDGASAEERALRSLGWQPVAAGDAAIALDQPTPTSLRLTRRQAGIEVEAVVTVVAEEPVELWTLRLRNLRDKARTIELTTYQEPALAANYQRHPGYNALHLSTVFVRELGALLVRNRHMQPLDPAQGMFSRETAFHAVGGDAGRLVGFEDRRVRFLGHGTLQAPEALGPGGMQDPRQDGLLNSFDPCVSLQVEVELPAGGTVELRLADGFAADEAEAARLIARHLGRPAVDPAVIRAAQTRLRPLDDSLRPPAERDTLPHSFAADGTELHVAWPTPRPWAHVMANPLGFGTVVSNDGAVYAFDGNAQQNAIIPFRLESGPAQAPAHTVYLLDLDTGEIDTPTVVPHRRPDAEHDATFGRGHAVLRKRTPERQTELTLCVPPDEPVQAGTLRIRNLRDRAARYRLVPHLELALAELQTDSRHQIETEVRIEAGTIFFRNPNNGYRRGWGFLVTSAACEAAETVRERFFGGPEHGVANPHLVVHGRGDAARPDDGLRTASLVATIEIPPGGEIVLAVTVGHADGLEEARALAATYRDPAAAVAALERTRAWWAEALDVLRVETNNPGFDRLVNDWLPYQALTSRLWGRCGPSQRGGAFGFRDQLQDVLPMGILRPELARAQILLHARQQFVEGDVLQWWHQTWDGQTGLGARNRASDPHLWLVHVTARYVRATGDATILHEVVPFVEGPEVPPGAEGIAFPPRPSRETASLYDHCRRAVERTLARLGPNGLPLIGSGDWNDGLDHAGIKGRGESVWLGFFLHDALFGLAELAQRLDRPEDAARCHDQAAHLRDRLEAMWHEDRYTRLVTDEGEELRQFCALVGSWPVLSGAVGLERGVTAVETALSGLEHDDLVRLLAPSFDEDSPLIPGRIARYPVGVRENGGQYSHGASWLVDALAELGERAAAAGNAPLTQRMRARAATVWLEISPLTKTDAAHIDRYGLPPHQQPADVYYGPGYEGRGGWSWYTGAAARMLSAAYAVMGLKLENGRLAPMGHLFTAKGPIQVKRVTYRGRTLTAERRESEARLRAADPAFAPDAGARAPARQP